MSDATRLSALVAMSALVVLTACFMGSTPLGLADVAGALLGRGDPANAVVVLEIRLPRASAAFAAGAALGASGAALQGLLRNPLAEPGVLGVTAASSLFATTVLYYGATAVTGLTLPLSSIAGALLATGMLAFVAMRTTSVATLILVGVGLSSLSGALMALLMNMSPNPFSLSDLINWTLGSVENRSLDDLWMSGPFILAGLAVLWVSRAGLSALTLGEEAAAGAGLDVGRQRLMVIAGAGLATGGAVALAGAIGFIGLVAPHIVRPWFGHDPARSLIPSALAAGAIMTLADIVLRLLPTVNELKLGVAAALFGAPVFIWIAIQRGRHGD